MPKFDLRDWVQKDGRRGIVTGRKDKNVLVRWVGDTKATSYGARSIRACKPPRAFVLEGSLDHWLHSTRSEEDLLRTWLKANKVTLAYKNVHSLEDIKILGEAIGLNKPLFVHISCHGWYEEGKAFIRFAPGKNDKYDIRLNETKTVRVFRHSFAKLPILFSACTLGKYQSEMEAFVNLTGLPCIAAFTRDIYEAEAMLFELLLYHGVYTNGWKFDTAVEKARDILVPLNVRGGMGKGQSLVRIFKSAG